MYPPYDLILKPRISRVLLSTLRHLIIVPAGLITSPWVVLVVLVQVFVVPGVVFCLGRRSGLLLRLLPLKPPPGLQKPVPGPPGPPRYSLLAPLVRLLRVLEYKFY